MSSARKKAEEDNSSCRDLDGRRLRTINEAKKLSDYLASLPERQKAEAEKQKEKLEKLKQEIGRMENEIAGAASGTGAGTKRKVLDSSFIEEGRERSIKVRGAVAAAMKKRKKQKTSPPAADDGAISSSKSAATDAKDGSEDTSEGSGEGSAEAQKPALVQPTDNKLSEFVSSVPTVAAAA